MTIKRFFALALALVVLFLAEAQSIVDNPVACLLYTSDAADD